MTVPPTFTPPSNRRRVWLGASLALLLTFAAGFALGWGLGYRANHGWPRRPFDGRHGPFDRLNLTAAQRTTVDSIFRARRTEITAFWQGPGRQLGTILDSTSADIRLVLDSAQRVKFDEMQRKFRNMRNRARAGDREHGPGGFPGGMGPGMGPGPGPGDGPGTPPPPTPEH